MFIKRGVGEYLIHESFGTPADACASDQIAENPLGNGLF